MIRFLPFLRLSDARYAQVGSHSYAFSQSFLKLIFLTWQLNRYCMGVFFFIPLTFIAFYESTSKRKYVWMENLFRSDDEAPQDCFENRDPEINDPNCEGLVISKVPFEELVKAFPKIDQVELLFLYVFVSSHR
jgi:hypothetical protein